VSVFWFFPPNPGTYDLPSQTGPLLNHSSSIELFRLFWSRWRFDKCFFFFLSQSPRLPITLRFLSFFTYVGPGYFSQVLFRLDPRLPITSSVTTCFLSRIIELVSTAVNLKIPRRVLGEQTKTTYLTLQFLSSFLPPDSFPLCPLFDSILTPSSLLCRPLLKSPLPFGQPFLAPRRALQHASQRSWSYLIPQPPTFWYANPAFRNCGFYPTPAWSSPLPPQFLVPSQGLTSCHPPLSLATPLSPTSSSLKRPTPRPATWFSVVTYPPRAPDATPTLRHMEQYVPYIDLRESQFPGRISPCFSYVILCMSLFL